MPPPRVIALPISTPANLYPDLVAHAATINAPNTDVGIYYADANGDVTRFRTFMDEEERAYYRSLWEDEEGAMLGKSEPNGGTRPGPVVFATAREGALALRAQNNALDEVGGAERHVAWELLGIYLRETPGNGAAERSPHWEEIRAITDHLLARGSGLRMMSAPGSGTIAFSPVAPAFAGEIAVIGWDGRVVWRGECSGPTSVDLTDQPSGIYFVTGSGQPLVVGIAH
jgi:hypothetical protein